jgi:hydrogenase maturation protein HypF
LRGGRGGETPLSPLIAPGLPHLGVMLPYTPLYEQLLAAFGKPIVATSGNRSNSPIVFEDEKAVEELGPIADYLLTNNRDITVPQDDSVVKFTGTHRRRIVLRRSRGMAPTFINDALDWRREGSLLATGAMLKSAFALLHRGNIYLSQYLGDLESFDTEENYRHTVRHFIKLLGAKPGAVVADKHPEYPSTRFGQAMANEWGVPFKTVQHHLAHFAAVLGENRLLDATEPVLGVVWDGTGYGDDGQVWGGEFFIFENGHFRRSCHFDYFNFMLGDKMPREPRISALSACHGLPGAADVLRQKFNDTEWRLYTAMLDRGSPLQTSSAGRIFDGVASLLGILDVQTYEGEAAMLLETLAERYVREQGADFSQPYFTEKNLGDGVPTAVLFGGILADQAAGRSGGFIAARFHCSLVVLIEMIARQQGLRQIAFSGGVFQNGLLVDLIVNRLGHDFDLFFHEELSPNDENIAFGQLVLYELGFDENLG